MDAALPEGVVPQGHHIGSRVEHLLGLLGGQAHIGGILPIDHREGGLIFPPELGQRFFQVSQALGPDHVAHGQNICIHIVSSRIFLPGYYIEILPGLQAQPGMKKPGAKGHRAK